MIQKVQIGLSINSNTARSQIKINTYVTRHLRDMFYVLSPGHFLFNITKFCYLILLKMVVLTRKQLEKLTKEERIDELHTATIVSRKTFS